MRTLEPKMDSNCELLVIPSPQWKIYNWDHKRNF